MGAAALALRGIASRLGPPLLPRAGLLTIPLLPIASLLPVASLLLPVPLMLPIALLPVAALPTIAWLVAIALLRVWLHGDICRALVRCRVGVRDAMRTYFTPQKQSKHEAVCTDSLVHRFHAFPLHQFHTDK